MTIRHSNGHLEKYYEDCKSGVHVIGAELMMELEKLMDDLQSDEYIYDTEDADRRMSFMEGCLRLTKSPFYGQPMVLMDFQKAYISALYGFYMRDGTQRFQRSLFLLARKNGKSELCSALLLTDMIIGGKGLDIVCASNNDDQAEILYRACDTMRLMIDPKSKLTWRNQKGIRCTLNDNKIFKMSDRSKTKEGRNIDTCVIDEVHEQKEPVIIKSIEQSQSLKINPKLILITTEGFIRGGTLDQELTRARAILRDEIEDLASERFLPWLYTCDSDRDVWDGNRDNRLWEKANPTLGVVKQYSYLEQQVDLARQNATDRTFVLCKDFNIPQSTSEAWLMPEEYEYDGSFDIESFRGAICLGAVDIAETTDLSCARVFLKKSDDSRMYVHSMYFIPEGKLERADDRGAGAKYAEWAEKGMLKICPGNYMDPALIADWFAYLYKEYGLRTYIVGYDQKFASEFLSRMEAYGFTNELIYQSSEVLNTPIRMVEADLKSQRIIGLNEMDRWCLSNCSLKLNSRGEALIVKAGGSPSKKIDGAVTLAIGYEVYRRHRTEFETAVADE